MVWAAPAILILDRQRCRLIPHRCASSTATPPADNEPGGLPQNVGSGAPTGLACIAAQAWVAMLTAKLARAAGLCCDVVQAWPVLLPTQCSTQNTCSCGSHCCAVLPGCPCSACLRLIWVPHNHLLERTGPAAPGAAADLACSSDKPVGIPRHRHTLHLQVCCTLLWLLGHDPRKSGAGQCPLVMHKYTCRSASYCCASLASCPGRKAMS